MDCRLKYSLLSKSASCEKNENNCIMSVAPVHLVKEEMPTVTPLTELAFQSLFKSHFSLLCAYCQYRFQFDLDTAKEAVHTSFIKLWENRRNLTINNSTDAFLFRIVKNTCLDIKRHQKVVYQHQQFILKQVSEESTITDADFADLRMLRQTIDKTVAEMPHQMRKVFELSRYEGLKYAQIASLLNISVKTVEVHMSRALLKLRKRLIDYTAVLSALMLSFS